CHGHHRGLASFPTRRSSDLADGKREKTVKASPLAEKWADTMTEKYEELAAKDTIFGELRNCMDLAVVSALIAKHHLLEKAGLDTDRKSTRLNSSHSQISYAV